MARKSNSYNSNRNVRDVPYSITKSPTLLALPKSGLIPIEDRRTFNPLGYYREARALLRPHHYLQAPVRRLKGNLAKTYTPALFTAGVQFKDSLNVVACIRRKVRKEVIHAFKNSPGGKGAKFKRTRRTNYLTSIKC